MRHTMTISYIMLAWVSKGIMCETNRARRQSGVYAMYYTLRKGALRGPQTSSEMGPMRGSKSGAFWGRGGGGHFPGGTHIVRTGVSGRGSEHRVSRSHLHEAVSQSRSYPRANVL